MTSKVTGSVKATKEGDKKDRDGRGLRWAAPGLSQSSPLCREKARLEGQERSKCKGPEEHPQDQQGGWCDWSLGREQGKEVWKRSRTRLPWGYVPSGSGGLWQSVRQERDTIQSTLSKLTLVPAEERCHGMEVGRPGRRLRPSL